MPDSLPPAPAVTFGDRLRNFPQYLLPQRLLTRLTYRLTRARSPWLKEALIRGFVRHFQVDLNEALELSLIHI